MSIISLRTVVFMRSQFNASVVCLHRSRKFLFTSEKFIDVTSDLSHKGGHVIVMDLVMRKL